MIIYSAVGLSSAGAASSASLVSAGAAAASGATGSASDEVQRVCRNRSVSSGKLNHNIGIECIYVPSYLSRVA